MLNFDKLREAANKVNEKKTNPDEGEMWRAEQDKAGNGFAIIKFLPGKNEDELPWVPTYQHGFKSLSGKWLIEECPTTIGKECPVCEANGELWNSGNEKDKEIVRARKRKLGYVSNVLVIQDPKNPDNEGKIFKFKYGKKIFDKIKDAMMPEVIEGDPDTQDPINPFDPHNNYVFKLKIRRVEGYANFDKSVFDEMDDVAISEKEWAKRKEELYDIMDYLKPARFKSYDAIKQRLAFVLGMTGGAAKANDQDNYDHEAPPPAKKAEPKSEPVARKETSSDDDDDMAYFRQLAEDDNPF